MTDDQSPLAPHSSDTYAQRKSSPRLPDYDYSTAGAYSVTICTQKKQPLFTIPALRKILEDQWLALPQIFPGIKLDTFVIMPDHIHLIVWIDEEREGTKTLSDIIGGYKSLVSVAWLRCMKENNIRSTGQIWQRSFHEHIIRNDLDLQEKQQYIINNPIVQELKNQSP